MNLVDRMPFVPRNLSYLVSKVSGYSRQKIKLIQQNRSSVFPGGTISFSFPEGAILDFSTFHIFATPVTNGPTGKYCTLSDIEDVINKINIKIGGVTITNVDQHYARLFRLLRMYQMGDKESIRGVVNRISSVTPAANLDGSKEFCINTFLGFLGSVSPSCIDSSLFQGPITIELVLNGPEVLVTSDGTDNGTGYTYILDNLYAEVDVIKMPDMYRQALKARMQGQDAYIELPFQQWTSFSSNGVALNSTPTVPWNLSSECINAIFATVYNNTKYTDTSFNATHKVSQHWAFGDSTLSTVHQKINGLSYPQSGEQNMVQSFINTYSALIGNQDTLGSSYEELKDLASYKNWGFVNVVKLSHDNDPSLMSGYSSAGGNLQGIVQFKGTGTDTCMPYVYIQSTARLLVRAGASSDGPGVVEVRY